jgi:hypothetical protein
MVVSTPIAWCPKCGAPIAYRGCMREVYTVTHKCKESK